MKKYLRISLLALCLVWMPVTVYSVRGADTPPQNDQQVSIFNVQKGKSSPMDKVYKSDEEWQRQLSPEAYRITRRKGTERAFTGKYHDYKGKGLYRCICCGTDLYSSHAKYDSGTGWPSFWSSVSEANVRYASDNSLFTQRTEVLCARCDAHLGHIFDDGPLPTRKRHCINSAALQFIEE